MVWYSLRVLRNENEKSGMSKQTNEQVTDKNKILCGTHGDVFFLFLVFCKLIKWNNKMKASLKKIQFYVFIIFFPSRKVKLK